MHENQIFSRENFMRISWEKFSFYEKNSHKFSFWFW